MKDRDKPIIQSITFEQPQDSCDGSEDYQRIEIGFHDAGGGYFWRIESAERWAVDIDAGKVFAKYLDGIANRNTRISNAEVTKCDLKEVI